MESNEFRKLFSIASSSYRKCMATIEKYKNWNEAEDYCHVEIWIPVERK